VLPHGYASASKLTECV